MWHPGVRNEFHDVSGRQTDQNSVRTSLGSNQGDVNVVAKGDLIARGADISAGNDVTLVGTNVLLDAATDTLTQAERHRVNQAGGTIALSGYGVQAAQAAEAAQRANESGDDRLAALYGAQAGYAARDAMQGTGAAVKVTVSVGSSSASSNSTLQQSTEQGSTVTAGRNVTVVATGDGTTGADGYAANGDITVRGGQIAAGNSAAFTASRDINFLSSQNSNELDGNSKSGSGSVGVGFGLGGSQNGFTIEIAAAAAQGQMQGNGTTHQATIVQAGNEVGLSSGRDTTLQGAQVIGDTVLANIGGDLTLSSSQDSQYYDQKDQNGGFGLSLCIPPLCFGASSGSVSYGQTDINNNYNSTTQQTGIAAGAGGYQIHVGNHTQLDGAVIASTADPSKNLLSTESLGITDLSNHANYSGGSWGGSLGFSGSIGDQSNGGLDPNAPTETSWNDPKASPSLGIPTGDSASSVTRSDISAGTVVVRNGDTSALDGLDRTVTDLQQEGLANNFDPTKVQQDLAAGVMAAELGFKTAGTVAEKMRNSAIEELIAAGNDPEAQKAAQAKIDTWSEGGTGKALLHGLTGALTAALGGGDALDGALGAATVEKAKGAMASYLGSIGLDPSSPLYDLIMEAGSLALGGAAGGTTGAATGLAGDQFNRQLHPDEVMYLAGRAGEFADTLFHCGNQCTEQQVTEARNRLIREAYAIVDSLARTKFPTADAAASAFILTGAPTFSWGEAFFENKEGAFVDNSFNKALYGSNTQAFDILTSALMDGGMTESAVRLAYNKQLLEMAGSARGRDGQMMLETLTGDIGGIISVFTGLFQGEYGKAGLSAAMLFIPIKLPFGSATGKVVAEVGEPIGQQAIKQGEHIAEQVAADILSSTPKGTTLPVKGPLPGAGAVAGETVAEQAGKQAGNAAEEIAKDVAEAAKNAPPPRSIEELLPRGSVPPVRKGAFNQWFDDLSVEELDMLWKDKKISDAIKSRIRHPGGEHEWCMVCLAPQFKKWGVSMDEMKRFRTKTKDLEWINPHTGLPGGHLGNKHGSTTFHNELEELIIKSRSLDEFNKELKDLVDLWKIDPNLLPPFPKT